MECCQYLLNYWRHFQYSFSSNKAVLKQSLVLLGTLDFTGSEQWATFNFPQFTVLSNEFLCFQIVVPSLTKKSHFCDIINNYYSDITNMKFENFSIYSLYISFENNVFTLLSFRIMWIVSNLATRETGINLVNVNEKYRVVHPATLKLTSWRYVTSRGKQTKKTSTMPKCCLHGNLKSQ